jgi:hypothetical protein
MHNRLQQMLSQSSILTTQHLAEVYNLLIRHRFDLAESSIPLIPPHDEGSSSSSRIRAEHHVLPRLFFLSFFLNDTRSVFKE